MTIQDTNASMKRKARFLILVGGVAILAAAFFHFFAERQEAPWNLMPLALLLVGVFDLLLGMTIWRRVKGVERGY
ncbi:MAG: hypothetical protein KDI98_04415 [Hyphomicrobiaceae bacterium]|nr:hypothetical protein [Hyphomicrobiaceae bacterium]